MIRNIVQSQGEPPVDIIGFQEVRLDESRLHDKHQMDLLRAELRELGFHYYVYRPAMSYVNGMSAYDSTLRHEEGLAIFSRYEILWTDTLLLARDLSDHLSHQRIALRARIRLHRELDIDFITTHSSLSETERDINVMDVEQHLKIHRGGVTSHASTEKLSTTGDVPQVIVGDFNAEPFERSVRLMLSEKMQWKDSYLEAMERGDRVFNKTFSVDAVYDKRIDYIMHRGSPTVRTKSVFYHVTHEQLELSYVTLNMSDHFFILSDIQFAYRDTQSDK